MKAMVNESFGPPEVMQLAEVVKPVPSEGEVLVKTYATSANTVDVVYRSGMKVFFGLIRLMTGIRRPKKKILGFDVAGEIVELGPGVENIKVGDKVFGGARSGANAEFTIIGADKMALIPEGMSYVQAASIPVTGMSALQGLRDSGEIKEGQKVMVYGASGGIGTFAVQIAKTYETDVTGVASGKNEELVIGLGADRFIDYTKTDFSQLNEKYDLIFDAVGKFPKKHWKNLLKENGIFVDSGSPTMSMLNFALRQFGNRFRSKKYRSYDAKYIPEDLTYVGQLFTEGKLEPVIDRTFELEKIAEAYRYYEQGHTKGKVIITLN